MGGAFAGAFRHTRRCKGRAHLQRFSLMTLAAHRSWSNLLGEVLRPARPKLSACLAAREAHVEARRHAAEKRAQAIAQCVSRIEEARAAVFLSGTGVVNRQMTELEREWRALSRPDVDGNLMDLWATIAPRSWLDRKRFRDAKAAERLDAAVALASDDEGVEAAERAALDLRGALAASGTVLPARLRWVPFERDFEGMRDLLENSRQRADRALNNHESIATIRKRARTLATEVEEGVFRRFENRKGLAEGIGHAAFVDFLWRAAGLSERENPVRPLMDLWRCGYTLSAIDASTVSLELPLL